jgi:hypothetical protein
MFLPHLSSTESKVITENTIQQNRPPGRLDVRLIAEKLPSCPL